MPVAQGGWLSLHLLESGQILPLSGREEFSLGRVAEGQPVMPDVDRTPFRAYSEGVSRLHAVLRRRGDRAFLMDLGSSNGTYLNGQRLPVNLELARWLEGEVRTAGAVPATVAVIDGHVCLGVTIDELERLALSRKLMKISRRDFGAALASRATGGTTVAATMVAAHAGGIRVFATGRIGGVHPTLAVKVAELEELLPACERLQGAVGQL